MRSQSAHEVLKRNDSAAAYQGTPIGEERRGIVGVFHLPEVIEQLFESIGFAKGGKQGEEFFAFLLLRGTEVSIALEKGVFVILQGVVLFALRLANLIHGLVERLLDMEAIEDHRRFFKVPGYPADEGRRGIDADLLDLRRRTVLAFQIGLNPFDGVGTLTRRDVKDPALLQIYRHGHVVMMFLCRGLIDAQGGHLVMIRFRVGDADPVIEDRPDALGIL